jgi:hypothetical protein
MELLVSRSKVENKNTTTTAKKGRTTQKKNLRPNVRECSHETQQKTQNTKKTA